MKGNTRMSGSNTAEQRGKVQVGDLAPDFTLPDQAGRPVSLHDFIGKSVVVLYFYPKDNTPGCTTEAVCFRDNYVVFKQAGAEVIGISSDSTESHEQFANQHRLPFILLSDRGAAVRKRYGVPTTLGLLPGRVTYIIDKRGVVRHIFSSQFNPEKHVEAALSIVRTLQDEDGAGASQAPAGQV
jgi:peroxiredoxin Q/BCP